MRSCQELLSELTKWWYNKGTLDTHLDLSRGLHLPCVRISG